MSTWEEVLAHEQAEPYFKQLLAEVAAQRKAGKTIYPASGEVFNAFTATGFEQVKVVILGQDPYHGPGQAHGLSFSVQHGVKLPPSLKNIFRELSNDIADFKPPVSGNLQSWAQQGVLLLNSVLTVEQGKAHSHAKLGWQKFTDSVIRTLSAHRQGIVFLLWGSHAQQKASLIDAAKHHILTSPHPSPLSAHRGFFGCRHFSQANQLLTAQGEHPVNWHLP